MIAKANVAGGYVEKKEDIVTLLQVQDSGGSNQVLLKVRLPKCAGGESSSARRFHERDRLKRRCPAS